MVNQQSTFKGIRELALFAGIGGGIIGGKLLGWRTVCAVERDAYSAAVLAQRQNDGCIEAFPIWSDVETFEPEPWRGVVDVVSGGFPCQDISNAGRGAGINGARSGMWFEMLRIVRGVQPKFVFIENVAAIANRGLATVLGCLAEAGFDAEWGVLSAAEIGARHKRERMWILAINSNSNSARELQQKRSEQNKRQWISDVCENVPNSVRTGLERQRESIYPVRASQNENRQTDWIADVSKPQVWELEPSLGRVADGVPHRVYRIKGLGNAQVPLCAATAFDLLYKRFFGL